MSSFCANCGTSTGGGRFCPKCGSPQQTAASTPPAPAVSQTPYRQPARSRSPVLMILLIVFALVVAIGGLILVKGFFFLKDTVQEAKREIDKTKMASAEKTKAGCALISKENISEILKTTIAATKGNEAGDLREYCDYLSPENMAAQTEASRDPDDEKNKENDSDPNGPSLKDLESLGKRISDATKNKALLSFQVFRGNASVAVFGIKTANRLTGKEVVKIPGPWDEAYFGIQETSFVARKGTNGILVDLTQVANKRNVGIAVAKAAVDGWQ